MDLQLPPPRRPPRRSVVHLMLWGVAGATLALFAVARDDYRGRAEVGDAVAFTAAFVATGYVLSALPRIWREAGRGRLAGCVTPGFMGLVMAYMVLVCSAGFVQPAATAIAVLMQVAALIVVCMRSP